MKMWVRGFWYPLLSLCGICNPCLLLWCCKDTIPEIFHIHVAERDRGTRKRLTRWWQRKENKAKGKKREIQWWGKALIFLSQCIAVKLDVFPALDHFLVLRNCDRPFCPRLYPYSMSNYFVLRTGHLGFHRREGDAGFVVGGWVVGRLPAATMIREMFISQKELSLTTAEYAVPRLLLN